MLKHMLTGQLIIFKNFINSNILGVHNILEVLRKIKREHRINIRFVQVSIDEVYWDMPFQKNR